MLNFRKKTVKAVHAPFFTQDLNVEIIENRLDLFKKYCNGKSVLHFGCTDYPIFNPERNLHIHLNTYVDELYGFDIDEPGIQTLKKYVDKSYFSSIKEVGNKYFDVCLIPETIEHVDNIKEFLEDIQT